ncbi:hypothetical protein BHM03_00052740 [Ensete ventricosum]|nr:hypothetical protein BHM03_00052740 [Ensete ventricosum]
MLPLRFLNNGIRAKAPCKGDRLRPRPLARGRLDAARASPQGQQLPAGIATYSVVPARAANCRASARSDRQWPARKGWPQQPVMPPTGAAAPVAGATLGEQGQSLPTQGQRR